MIGAPPPNPFPGSPAAAAARPHQQRGFTLLEALIALAMLAAVFSVCAGLRTQAMAADRRAAAILEAERDADALFQMVINRALLAPEPLSNGEKAVWVGTHLGEPYTIERTIAVMENPLLGVGPHETAPEIGLFEYAITYKGHTTKAIWHR